MQAMDSMASERTLMTFEGLGSSFSNDAQNKKYTKNTFLHFNCDGEDENLAERRPRRHSGPASLGMECSEPSFHECQAMPCEAISSESVTRSFPDESFQATELIPEPVTFTNCSIDEGRGTSSFPFEASSEPLSVIANRCFSVRSVPENPSEVPLAFHGDFDGCEPFESSILSEPSDESLSESSPRTIDDPEFWKQQASSSGAHQSSQESEQHGEADAMDFNCKTVMVKNIPCACTKREVLAAFDEAGFEFDFFYMPTRRSKYIGYGFVGFSDPHTTQQFAKAMTGYRFKTRNSPKTLEVVPARIQGVENKKKHFRRRSAVTTRRMPTLPSQNEAQEENTTVEA